MKYSYLYLLLLIEPALPGQSLAIGFTYPGQYNTYNRPAEGYKSESTERTVSRKQQEASDEEVAAPMEPAGMPAMEGEQAEHQHAMPAMEGGQAEHQHATPAMEGKHAEHQHPMPAMEGGEAEHQDAMPAMDGKHAEHHHAASQASAAAEGADEKHAQAADQSKLKYVCPMHPDEVHDHPGSCPQCGMDLVSFCTTAKAGDKGASAMAGEMASLPGLGGGAVSYVCPMHPNIVSSEPGRCPICGMDLVQHEGNPQGGTTSRAGVVSLNTEVVQKMGVRTAAVVRGSMSNSYKTVGRVRYNERRVKDVVSRTYGWVDNLAVRTPGMTVQRGQLLLELYSPDYLNVQKDFLAAHERDHSAGQLKRYGEREETVPTRDYMRYLDVPESAINELAREGKPRFRLPIYAPQYGVLIRNELHKKMYVYPGQLMFTIADLSSVWVEVELFEHQLAWLRRKLKAELQVDALPGKKIEGWVNYIHPEMDPRTRTVTARLLVPNPDGILRPNMLAQVEIFAEGEDEMLKIPREALIETGTSKHVILAMGDGHFRPVEVVSGIQGEGEVEILSGLQEGERVVTSGQFLIDSEANLKASFRRFGSHH